MGSIDAFIRFMETTDPLLRDAILTVFVTFPLWLTIGVLALDALRGPYKRAD